MKKILTATVLALLLLTACGGSQEPVQEAKKTEPDTVKIIQTEKDAQEIKPGTVNDPAPGQPKTEEKPVILEDGAKQDKITMFKGQHVSCQIPESWASQEDLSQNVAAALLDPTTRAGVVIQIRKDAVESLQEIAEGINAGIKGVVDDYSIGSYAYKRITASIDGRNVIYLLTKVGSTAFYISTDIFDKTEVQMIIKSLALK